MGDGLSLTCLHQVVHGGKALANCGADGAQDEQRGQIYVAHQRAAQQAAVLVPTVDAAARENVLDVSAKKRKNPLRGREGTLR